MTAPQSSPTTLRISRIFEARRERVFRAWTEPERLAQWMAPAPLTVTLVEVDLRPGGYCRFHLQEPEGREYRVSGVYAVVERPSRLVFSWKWELEEMPASTRVTVEFIDRGKRTEVLLIQEFIPTGEMCDLHLKGWTGCLEKLPGVLGGMQ